MLRDGNIYNDTDARVMSAEQLSELPAPVALGPRHKPIPYIDIATNLVDAAERAGLTIEGTQWAVGKYRNVVNHAGQAVRVDNAEMVGLVSVSGGGLPKLEDAAWQIAYQGGQAEHLAQRLMAGKDMFVCTNLALLGGEMVMKKKATTGLWDLPGLFDTAVERFLKETVVAHDLEQGLRRKPCSDDLAYQLAAKAVMQNVIPGKSLKGVLSTWHEGEFGYKKMPDVAERNLYGLYNSFTREIRPQHLMQQAASSAKIGRYFGVAA